MSTLRISNIEAKSVPASATVDEKVKITNSSGDTLVFIDGKTSGITTVGINTTDGNITFDANSNVVVTGIITATKFVGAFEPTDLPVSGDLSISDKIIHTGDTNTAIRFPAADTITAETGGSERLRITSGGSVGVGDYSSTNLTHAFQALRTSGSTYVSSKNTGGNALFYAEASSGNTAKLELMQAGVGNFTLEVGSTNALMFKDDGTERLRIDSNGNLLLNGGSLRIDGTGEFAVYESDTSLGFNNSAQISLDFSSNVARIRSTASGSGTNRPLALCIGSSEKLRIDSGGRILKGLTSPRGNYGNNTSGVEYGVQIEGTSAIAASVSIVRNSNDSNDGGIILGKTRATSNGGNTVVQAGDDLGNLTFAGNDGSTMLFGAEIVAEVQSGVGNDDMPTDLIFKTNQGSTGTTERFRITANGNLEWRNRSVKQRKHGAFLGINSAGTSDIKISGNFENNDMLRVRWAYNWNAGDGGAWGEAVIWKQYEGTKRVRYLTDVKASPLTSVSFPHSGNDIWLRWQTNAGINGWYMIDVECHGCDPFPF